METFSEIERIITEIPDKTPTVIYFGVGSHFCGYNFISDRHYDVKAVKSEYWNNNLNQQYPIFLSRIREQNRNIKIVVILIDPEFREVPYMINDANSYLNGTFERVSDNNYYSRRYDVDVYYYREYITWDSTTYREGYNITEFMCKYIDIVSRKNTVLTYHEYVGRDVYDFRKILRNKCFTYDDRKICIDITNGRNLACYIDLSELENIPIIRVDGYNKISYINPDEITLEEQKYYIKRMREIEDVNRDEYIVGRQIEGIMKTRMREIKDYVIPFYRIMSMEEINEDMGKYYLRKINEMLMKEENELVYNLNYFTDMYIKTKSEEDKKDLMDNIMTMMKLIIKKYNYVYGFTIEKNIDDMIEEMKRVDKYKMSEIFMNFYKKYF